MNEVTSEQTTLFFLLRRVKCLEQQPFGDHDLGHLFKFWKQVHVSRQQLDRVGLADGWTEVAIEQLGEELLILHCSIPFLKRKYTRRIASYIITFHATFFSPFLQHPFPSQIFLSSHFRADWTRRSAVPVLLPSELRWGFPVLLVLPRLVGNGQIHWNDNWSNGKSWCVLPIFFSRAFFRYPSILKEWIIWLGCTDTSELRWGFPE